MDLPVDLVSEAVDLLALGPADGVEISGPAATAASSSAAAAAAAAADSRDGDGDGAYLFAQLERRCGCTLSAARRIALLERLGAHPSVRVASLQPLRLAATAAAVQAARLWRGSGAAAAALPPLPTAPLSRQRAAILAAVAQRCVANESAPRETVCRCARRRLPTSAAPTAPPTPLLTL